MLFLSIFLISIAIVIITVTLMLTGLDGGLMDSKKLTQILEEGDTFLDASGQLRIDVPLKTSDIPNSYYIRFHGGFWCSLYTLKISKSVSDYWSTEFSIPIWSKHTYKLVLKVLEAKRYAKQVKIERF